MMIKILLFSILLCFFHLCEAQDLIILKSGSFVKAKEISMGSEHIIFRDFNSGSEDSIAKEKICYIKFANGESYPALEDSSDCPGIILSSGDSSNSDTMIFTSVLPEKVSLLFNKGEKSERKKTEPYLHGVDDADKNFNCKKAFWTSLAVTAIPFMAVPGLITTSLIAMKSPSDPFIKKSIGDENLLQNDLYMEGYKKAAKRKKARKAFLGFGIGLAIEVVGIIILDQFQLLPQGDGSGSHSDWD